jgi:hypothetical protein
VTHPVRSAAWTRRAAPRQDRYRTRPPGARPAGDGLRAGLPRRRVSLAGGTEGLRLSPAGPCECRHRSPGKVPLRGPRAVIIGFPTAAHPYRRYSPGVRGTRDSVRRPARREVGPDQDRSHAAPLESRGPPRPASRRSVPCPRTGDQQWSCPRTLAEPRDHLVQQQSRLNEEAWSAQSAPRASHRALRPVFTVNDLNAVRGDNADVVSRLNRCSLQRRETVGQTFAHPR